MAAKTTRMNDASQTKTALGRCQVFFWMLSDVSFIFVETWQGAGDGLVGIYRGRLERRRLVLQQHHADQAGLHQQHQRAETSGPGERPRRETCEKLRGARREIERRWWIARRPANRQLPFSRSSSSYSLSDVSLGNGRSAMIGHPCAKSKPRIRPRICVHRTRRMSPF